MEVSRRDLLRGAAAAAAAAVPFLADAALAHDEEEGHASEGEEGHAPGGEEGSRIRRYVMVIDQRRCDGCVGLGIPPQCTQGCIWSRFVPEGHQWIEVYRVAVEHLEHAESSGSHFLPAPCMQCQNAPCVNVCPVGATFHTPEGVVLVDQERCIGCRLCMAACPYDRRFFNWGEPVQPPDVRGLPYDVRTQIPAMRGTVMKCDFCMDRTAAGGVPVCVDACPRGAIYFGDLEEGIATNGRDMVTIDSLLREDGVARYKEELGTQPRVYYIPGHGELAGGGVEGGDLLKEKLEWPWREINAYLEELDGAAAEGATDG